MKRVEPGQVRVHRGFMRAGGSWELWPVEVVGAHHGDTLRTASERLHVVAGT